MKTINDLANRIKGRLRVQTSPTNSHLNLKRRLDTLLTMTETAFER